MSLNEYPRIVRSSVDGKYRKFVGLAEPQMKYATAGIVTPHDIKDVEAVAVLDEVLGLARPQYSLRRMCRVEPNDKLILYYDVYDTLAAQEKVPPLVEAEIADLGRERKEARLWKNVVHVAASDEAQMMSIHNEMPMQISDAAKALAYSENKQIKEAAEAGTVTSVGSDWSAVSDGRSTNNPFVDIGTALDAIEDTEGFNANLLVANRAVWSAFFGNDFVKGQLQGVVYPGTNEFDVPGLPGIRGLKDGMISAEVMLVADTRNAVILADGPTSAEKYREPKAGYDAYQIRQWLKPQIAIQDALYRLTGVLS